MIFTFSEMDTCIQKAEQAYEKMLYREALKEGFYEFQATRDKYREVSLDGMHKDLVLRYIEVITTFLDYYFTLKTGFIQVSDFKVLLNIVSSPEVDIF